MKIERDPNSMQSLKIKMRMAGLKNKDIKKAKEELRKISSQKNKN